MEITSLSKDLAEMPITDIELLKELGFILGIHNGNITVVYAPYETD